MFKVDTHPLTRKSDGTSVFSFPPNLRLGGWVLNRCSQGGK